MKEMRPATPEERKAVHDHIRNIFKTFPSHYSEESKEKYTKDTLSNILDEMEFRKKDYLDGLTEEEKSDEVAKAVVTSISLCEEIVKRHMKNQRVD